MLNLSIFMRTYDFVTKYELAKVYGLRVLQITETGTHAHSDPKSFVLREILDGKNPCIVRRRLPDGTHEDRPFAQLRLPRDLRRLCETLLTSSCAL